MAGGIQSVHDVLVRPLITEKNTMLMERGKYGFEVHRQATKIQIREAVEKTFNVKVQAVNTRITPRHRGGGHKRNYRIIDFKRNKHGIPAKVFSIEYDPNRSARIALLHYRDGEKRYILAPLGIKVGDVLMSGPDAEIRAGNALP